MLGTAWASSVRAWVAPTSQCGLELFVRFAGRGGWCEARNLGEAAGSVDVAQGVKGLFGEAGDEQRAVSCL